MSEDVQPRADYRHSLGQRRLDGQVENLRLMAFCHAIVVVGQLLFSKSSISD